MAFQNQGCAGQHCSAFSLIESLECAYRERKSGEWSSSVLKWLFNAASGAATPPWSPTTSTSVALHLPWREHNSTACHLSWPRSEASPKSRCHFSSTRQLREPSASTMYTTEYHPSQNHQPMIMRQQSPQKGIGHFVHYPASLVFQLDGTLILYSI